MDGRLSRLYDTFLKKQPKQSRSRAVVEAILVAAAHRLAGAGDSDEITVQEVADRAGVGIGSLYDYFRDRRSLLAGVAAKLTEDNLRGFEAALATTRAMSLEASVAAIVDYALETYAAERRVPRAVLRIAHEIGLMPTLAASQAAFAQAMATELRQRSDVGAHDLDATAYVLTNAVMGVVQALLWEDEPAHPREIVRRALIDACVAALRAEASSPPSC